MGLSQRNRFLEGISCHHQTGTRQDAPLVSLDNGVVNAVGNPKVISIDNDEPAHRAVFTPSPLGGEEIYV